MPTERLRRLGEDGFPPDLRTMLEANSYEKQEFLKLAKEASRRSCEALRLYRPLPFQEAYHACGAKELVLCKANRAGGSLCGFAEDARAVTGQDPYHKYPLRDGTCVCLGFGEKHVGRVIHKFLFRAGGFRIIRDEETKEWRVFRPWPKEQGGDNHREEEARQAPPLLPPRFIEEITWEKRGDRIFSIARMTSGWEIYALNSAGDPSQAQGFDVNLYHIDEDTAQPGWYEEAVGRTAIPKGLIRWTALPHAKNDDMMQLIERAEADKDNEKPTSVCIRATMFDNPYYPEESKKHNLKIWESEGEDVVRKRAYGEITLDSILMYPTFSRYRHDITRYVGELKIADLLQQNAWNPPADWCVDMITDPGHTVMASAFIATPPPSLGHYHIMFGELYIRNCDAEQYGYAVERFLGTGRRCERFIIDSHGGALTDIGSGIRPQEQYEEQLRKRNIGSYATAHTFIPGSDDIRGRETKLRSWLRVRDDANAPTFLVVGFRCPNFMKEMERFKKKVVKQVSGQVILDEGNRRLPCHAVECAEYASAHGLEYVAPRKSVQKKNWVQRIKEERARRELSRRAKSFTGSKEGINLGPRGSS